MKRSTTNKLQMYQSIVAVMDQFQSSWQTVPTFAAAMNNFNTKLDLLRVRLTQQSIATDGVASEKRMKTADLRERILVIQSALTLFGNATGNHSVEDRNNIPKSDLEKFNISKLALRCTEIRSDLTNYSTQLVDYGITDQMMMEIIPMLDNFNEMSSRVHIAILNRKSATQSIKELEYGLDKLLSFEMDRLILTFKKTQPDFFNAFKNARIVIDYGNKHGSKSPTERDDGQRV